jgi:predicted RNase H-like HicB family nuclease
MPTLPQPPDVESFSIVFDREEDCRWIAEVPELPEVMTYGKAKQDAEANVTVLALRVLADSTEQGARKPPKSIRFRNEQVSNH